MNWITKSDHLPTTYPLRHLSLLLDVMESSAKGNDNFAIKVKSTETVDEKSYIFKKKIWKK